MALRTKIEPLSDWISITVDKAMAPEARSKAVADFARAKLAETQLANQRALGREPTYEQFVDGRPGAALETVNPDHGRIVFEFELFGDVLTWIMQTLQERSPVQSGAYKRGHRLFADGQEIDAGAVMTDATEYSFTNTVPYARRLEIGKTKAGRDFVIQVDNRIYERTAKDARARFGNIARIGFTYRGIVGGAMINQSKAASSGQPWWLGGANARHASGAVEIAAGKRSGRTAHNKSSVRYPTIVVMPN